MYSSIAAVIIFICNLQYIFEVLVISFSIIKSISGHRFFLIFDKAYGINENFSNDPLNEESRHSPTFEDASFIEIRRDGGTKEWSIKGSPIQITTARSNADDTSENITPPKQAGDDGTVIEVTSLSLRERALEEIKEVKVYLL